MHRQTSYLSSAQTDMAEQQQNSNVSVALAVAVVVLLCPVTAHTHVLCSCTDRQIICHLHRQTWLNSSRTVICQLPLLLLWLHSCVLLRHMFTYSARAQTDTLSAICTYRHGCTAAEQQHVSCPSSAAAAALVVLLCSDMARSHVLCFALPHVTCRDLGWINSEILGSSEACLHTTIRQHCTSLVLLRFCVSCLSSHQSKAQESLSTPQASPFQCAQRHHQFDI